MTETVLSSANKEVRIGFDRPFVVIGERINPTGRKILAEEMSRGDFSRVEADAIAQVEAGAHMLDVNAGIPLADEPAILAATIKLVQSITDVPLSIDSSIVAALESGLSVYQGKALVNSVTGEDEQMEVVLPLDYRPHRLVKKIEAGAQFIQTQYCFDLKLFKEYISAVRDIGALDKAFILAGVGPLASAKSAEWIRGNVPGVHIPDHVIQRLAGADDQQEEGISICIDMIREIREIEGVHGIHIMAFRQEHRVAEIVERSEALDGRELWHPGDPRDLDPSIN